MKTVFLNHIYANSAEDVWRVTTDFGCLRQAVRGLLSFEGLSEGSLHEGQVLDVKVSMFGVLPAQPYRMELIAFDPKNLTFNLKEFGMGVKHWQHRLRIVPHANGAELIDEIEIEAGWRTGMITA